MEIDTSSTLDIRIYDIPNNDLSVRFLRCCNELSPYVSGYNVYGLFGTYGPTKELYIPSWTTVRFNWPGDGWQFEREGATKSFYPCNLIGPSSQNIYVSLPNNALSFGFSITPLGMTRLFGLKTSNIANKIIDLSSIWPDALSIRKKASKLESSEELAKYFDELLLSKLGPPSRDEALVMAMMNFLTQNHQLEISDIISELGVSESTARRISLKYFGFPLKLLLRRSRFLKSFLSIYSNEKGNWALLIEDCYHDQSHFIKDCQAFLGMTISEFLRSPSPLTKLSFKARMAALGAPISSMHR